MTQQDSWTTRLKNYIAEVLPWTHGHQLKGLTTFVDAIIQKQTGNQAELARGQGNQEAAVKRLSRLLHNARLGPHRLADSVLAQALEQLPAKGTVRLALDWTIEAPHHLLVVSLVLGGRAVPIYWRAYDAAVLKGRLRRYETAVIRRAITRVQRKIGPRRLLVTADRGFAEVALVDVLTALGVEFLLRVKGGTNVCWHGRWRKLTTVPFVGNARQRNLGRVAYGESTPHRLWVTLSRVRNAKGQGEIWNLISNRPRRAKATVSTIYASAAVETNEDRRKELAKWAANSESDGRINAMISLARSEPGIPVTPRELNSDPWLFNVVNGTIDLRTGQLREHRREDMITMLAPVVFDPKAYEKQK